MQANTYLMENKEEAFRLDLKTDPEVVKRQAVWAGIKPGMRIADIGCGSGKTTAILHQLVQPGGSVVGVDSSRTRICQAEKQYGAKDTEFVCRDITESLKDMGKFDFVWVRFLLEYYRTNNSDIVRNISSLLKPGGILCLIDLDYNCLTHFGMSPKLERTLHDAIRVLEDSANFDPYVGRKLYAFLYDLGYQDINVDISAHHLIFGELRDADAFNWMKKIEVVSSKINFSFEGENWGYEEFVKEFQEFFADPRRFTYSPLISCRGRKP